MALVIIPPLSRIPVVSSSSTGITSSLVSTKWIPRRSRNAVERELAETLVLAAHQIESRHV